MGVGVLDTTSRPAFTLPYVNSAKTDPKTYSSVLPQKSFLTKASWIIRDLEFCFQVSLEQEDHKSWIWVFLHSSQDYEAAGETQPGLYKINSG